MVALFGSQGVGRPRKLSMSYEWIQLTARFPFRFHMHLGVVTRALPGDLTTVFEHLRGRRRRLFGAQRVLISIGANPPPQVTTITFQNLTTLKPRGRFTKVDGDLTSNLPLGTDRLHCILTEVYS